MEGSAGGSQGGSLRKSLTRKKMSENGSGDQGRRVSNGERTVKRLRMSKALTVPDNTTVYEACRRMAARRVDAVLVTDPNALLCGILTDKDIAVRVVAAELNPNEITVAKVMTRNPVFALSDTLSVEALQKMVQGKFRHLPVVENGEVIALLSISKCLYDVIARMERAVEKGKAIAAAIEGVEKQWGTSTSGSNTFLDTLRERIFKPPMSTIISEKMKIATVSPTDSVLSATKKMTELRLNSAVVTVGNKPCGILTSKDILMRVIVQNLSPEATTVEKVMTPNPECATVDTPILDALHIMHDGKFLHLPIVDRDGFVVAVTDVIQITHSAVSQVGNTGMVVSDTTNSTMQKFWDSAMSLGPVDDEDDSQSDASTRLASEGTETGKSGYVPVMGSRFGFKLEDRKGRLHRFDCDTTSVSELIACIIQRIGNDINRNSLPQIMYEDEEHDKVLLASDSDLVAAVEHARLAGWKWLRLHLDYCNSDGHSRTRQSSPGGLQVACKDSWGAAYGRVAAGAALVAGLVVLAYWRRTDS
ncbi:CBS domain-containing protein [Nymphaea thermarum]|nr:CBS domain-containing protein [Nymphaea thermarum]